MFIPYPVKSVVCGKRTANQKPKNFPLSQREDREIRDIKNQLMKHIQKCPLWIPKSSNWNYGYL